MAHSRARKTIGEKTKKHINRKGQRLIKKHTKLAE
jgi:hypothetical protein